MSRSHRRLAVVLGAVVSLCVTGTVRAGWKGTSRVWVDLQHNRASGYVGAAHDSAEAAELINCFATGVTPAGELGIAAEMSCGATDAAGNTLTCRSSDPAMIENVGAINSDSYVVFDASPSDPRACIALLVGNYSTLPPKQL